MCDHGDTSTVDINSIIEGPNDGAEADWTVMAMDVVDWMAVDWEVVAMDAADWVVMAMGSVD